MRQHRYNDLSRRDMTAKICIIALLSLLAFIFGHGQPVASSKQLLGGIEIYGDINNNNLYYYAPGDLTLTLEKDGKPKFQLLQMRYTGSSSYGDNGEKRFMNVVQVSVSMEQASAEVLKAVKQKLNTPSVDLRPLPIRSIDAFLVAPVGESKDGSAYKKIGKNGSFQAEGKSGASDKYGFWTERTFTLKLENHEAQLLWDQVESGQLALSLGYAFYADMVSTGKADIKVDGDRKLAEGFESATEDLLKFDTVVVTQSVKANAFPLGVDVVKWPGVLMKIDINEGVPPGYAALEVRCFDFANDLRPDLAVKGIDITATGAGGQTVSISTQKFLRSERDLFAKQIRFPYAVKLTQPYRYRIVEYTLDGNKRVSEWTTSRSWSSHLDITTPEKGNAFLKKEIDIEVPLRDFDAREVAKVDVHVKFFLAGKPHSTIISYERADLIPVKQTTFMCDKGTPLKYEALWTFADESTRLTDSKHVPEDNYLYLIVPDD